MALCVRGPSGGAREALSRGTQAEDTGKGLSWWWQVLQRVTSEGNVPETGGGCWKGCWCEERGGSWPRVAVTWGSGQIQVAVPLSLARDPGSS